MRPMFDEMNATTDSVREHYQGYQRWLSRQSTQSMQARREEAEMIFSACRHYVCCVWCQGRGRRRYGASDSF